MKEELLKQAGDYLNEGKLLQLATSSNSNIWMSHVWYAYDQNKNEIYFASKSSTRHSKDIEDNHKIAGGVMAIELEGLGQKVTGVNFEGQAYLVEKADDVQKAYNAYANRWDNVKNMFTADDIITDSTDMRMYLIIPTRIVLFDEVNFPDEPKQEIIMSNG